MFLSINNDDKDDVFGSFSPQTCMDFAEALMVLRTVIDRVLTDSNKIIQLENPESVDIEFL